MDLQWINGTDSVAEMATKTNVNFNALQEGVSGEIATSKTEAITETQTWAKGTFNNPPLNINGDFKIQQRGTSFVAPSNVYTADRYKCNGSGTVTLTANGMVITGTVTVNYIMETADYNKISGKTITLSYSLNGVVTTSTYTASSATVMSLTITDKALNWVKIELGSVATPFVPSDIESIRSLKYYNKQSDVINSPYSMLATSTTTLNGSITFPTPMRITPTLRNIVLRSNANGSVLTVTGFSKQCNEYGINALYSLTFASGSLVVGNWYTVTFEADAEL